MVATTHFLKVHALSLTSFTAKFRFSKLSVVSFSSSPAQTLSSTLDQCFSYGPSLSKGAKPFRVDFHPEKILHSRGSVEVSTDIFKREFSEEAEENSDLLDEEIFTRVFDVAALRVPSKDCYALECRLRGHLLNWPRIRNIARVPGDEVEDELVKLVDNRNLSDFDHDNGVVESLQRRIYGKAEDDGEPLSPILYRDKLVKTFNSRGFVKFRNLAKMSRPKKKRRKEEENNDARKIGKSEFSKVEVVEEEEDDMKGLLGHEFKGGKWKGSTRLLLLDERYADKCITELPEAIKASLEEYTNNNASWSFDLVMCKLTLFYKYWQMNEVLEHLLPKGMIVPSAFETVGHIAHLNLRDEHLPFKRLIAKVVLDKNKPKIQTVVNKIDAIDNEYRTMQLEILAGNHSLVTMLVENGSRFHADLATVYWNSRLATERQRLLSGFARDDVVCDVFAGVGPISIAAAKIVKRVYANDLNPHAVEYLVRNSVLNKLEKKIQCFNMDARRFISAMFASEKAHSITQVVMNLPKDAAEYLDVFRGILRDQPKDKDFNLPMIHVYGFSKAQDPEFEFHERIRIALVEVGVDVNMHRVRLVAPGKWMLCASFLLPASVAFAKPVIDA